MFDILHGIACSGARPGGADSAADYLSLAIAVDAQFWPALAEKARLWAAVGDWDQVRGADAHTTYSCGYDLTRNAIVPALVHTWNGLGKNRLRIAYKSKLRVQKALMCRCT